MVPGLIPVTMPVVLPTGAIADKVLLHIPPVKLLPSVMLWPWHTSVGPVIAVGTGFTVTVFCAGQPPTKYCIVSTPALRAANEPVLVPIVPMVVLILFQVPPGKKSW